MNPPCPQDSPVLLEGKASPQVEVERVPFERGAGGDTERGEGEGIHRNGRPLESMDGAYSSLDR